MMTLIYSTPDYTWTLTGSLALIDFNLEHFVTDFFDNSFAVVTLQASWTRAEAL